MQNAKKTYEGWEQSGLSLSKYLEVGDTVDAALEMYFLEVLPPACWSPRCIQLGEAATHDGATGRPMFETLEKIDGAWTYTGVKATPDGEASWYE